MNVKNITFGRKIPLMKASVIDNMSGKKVPVTLSEYDCFDYPNDINMFLRSASSMNYANSIAHNMRVKYHDFESPYKFYVLEDENEKAVCICQAEKSDNNLNIEFIESKHDDEHKYAGQTMIAMLGKILLNGNGHNLYVLFPLPSAINFYLKKCGFEFLHPQSGLNKIALVMPNHKIKKFINSVQHETGSQIIDLNA